MEVMKEINDKSVDMILCDLPYGTTACKWDSVIPFEPLWEHYKRIIKDKGAIVLTASQPFASALVMSNIEWFKYEWVWVKNRATGHAHAKNKPMKKHENICIFSNGVTLHPGQSERRMGYYPQGLKKEKNGKTRKRNDAGDDAVMSKRNSHKETVIEHSNYPVSLLNFDIEMNSQRVHPTQKPVALFEYLIKTYTDEGETVLDNCIGSGTTAIAALNTNRNFIGIEKDEEYYKLAKNRVLQHSNTNVSTDE